MGNHTVDCDACGEDLRGLGGGHAPDCPTRNPQAVRKSTPTPEAVRMSESIKAIPPDIMAAFDRMLTGLVAERMQEVDKVLEELMLGIAFADPKVLVDTLWMPEDISPNCTVYDHIALARQNLCHPGEETEWVPCHDENCDRHGTPHFEDDSCEG